MAYPGVFWGLSELPGVPWAWVLNLDWDQGMVDFGARQVPTSSFPQPSEVSDLSPSGSSCDLAQGLEPRRGSPEVQAQLCPHPALSPASSAAQS